VDTILKIGLVNAVLASGLALTAWLFGRLDRWPAIAHSLWLLVLLKLLTPGLIEVPLSLPASWQQPSRAEPSDDTLLTVDPELGDLAYEPLDSTPAILAANSTNESSRPAARAPELAHARSTSARWSQYWKPAVLAFWLTGSVVFWAVALFRIRQVRALIRSAQPAPASLHDEVSRLARRLGVSRSPSIWQTDLPLPPMLWAVLSGPKLLLPVSLWNSLDADQRTTLLVHELAHLRNGDHWVRRLELLALGFYWWHPAAWWARRQLLEAEEQRCDATVVNELPQSTCAYAQTLLDTVAFLSRARSKVLLGASSMGQVRILKRRIAMIVQQNRSHRWSKRWAGLVLGVGALLLPLLPTQAQTQAEKREKVVETPSPVIQQSDPRRQEPTSKHLAPQVLLENSYRREMEKVLATYLGGPIERPAQQARPDESSDRLEELEKKVAALLKEIQAMRREQGATGNAETPRRVSAIDLQPWGNVRLDAQAFHSGQYAGNNLASLPAGERKLGGVPFKVGEKLLQLGKSIEKPEKIENIKVGRKLSKLYILQATGYIAGDGTEIAKYTVHYEDGATTTIPVVYGADVLDWWNYPGSAEPTRGKVVWNGENEPARKEYNASIRLYMTTWKNPRPDVRISSIDYEVSGDTDCLPFCIAMTAESYPTSRSGNSTPAIRP
jgi:beta-lactamase regulating signal transducer with metallopeptidase domain